MFNLTPHLVCFFTILSHESLVFFDLVMFCLQPSRDVVLNRAIIITIIIIIIHFIHS